MPSLLRPMPALAASSRRRVLARVRAGFDVRDATFLLGLALLSAGAALAYEPAGLMVPGAVLIWQALSGRRAT